MRRYMKMKETNLLELIGSDVSKTEGKLKLTIKGETKYYQVYKIPLNSPFYNDRNGRIATNISKYNDEIGALNTENIDSYNDVIHEFIVASNKQALLDTKKNIKDFGQRKAGVVLKNGRIIDGNRRFTCLRELAKEDGKDYYFEAVILDTDNGITEKDIKRLELNLQHAEEKPVDYNPIDNLVDIYKDLVENLIFTDQEYATSTNKKLREVEKLKAEAILMVEFLEFINVKGKYFIARDLKLDGPLQEMMSILKKVGDEQKQDVKYALFSAMITSENGDLTRHIRTIGNDVIKTDRVKEFLEEYEDVVEAVHDTLHEEEIPDMAKINQVLTNDKKIKEAKKTGNKIIDRQVEVNRTTAARNKPIDELGRAFDIVDNIDTTAVSHMNDLNQQELKEILDKLQAAVLLLNGKLNV